MRSGCARRTSSQSWCSRSTSRARRPGSWPASVSARSCNDPPHPRGPHQAGQAGDGQGGGSGEAGVRHRAHGQGDHGAARPRARRGLWERGADQPGGERGHSRAEAAHGPALGQVAPQTRGRGGQSQGSGDHGGLAMADDLLAQIRGNGVVPRHVAVIMDGNGRSARERSLPRPLGHRAGMKAVREVVEGAIAAGVEVLTLFAFSAENWQRPLTEISALMELLEEYIAREVAELREQGVAVHVLGDRTRLAPGAREAVERVEYETRDGAKLALNLCISYSSRAELARAARLLAEDVLKGAKRLEDIGEDAVREKLYTAPWGDPDLLIRTSGEYRLSNFLLLQLAYTELYVTPLLSPRVARRDLFGAILDYQRRDRRFGKVPV